MTKNLKSTQALDKHQPALDQQPQREQPRLFQIKASAVHKSIGPAAGRSIKVCNGQRREGSREGAFSPKNEPKSPPELKEPAVGTGLQPTKLLFGNQEAD